MAVAQQFAHGLAQGRLRQGLSRIAVLQPLTQARITLKLLRHIVGASPHPGQVIKKGVRDTMTGFHEVLPVLTDQHR